MAGERQAHYPGQAHRACLHMLLKGWLAAGEKGMHAVKEKARESAAAGVA